MVDKYSNKFSKKIVKQDFLRLTNQLWKLIPMRENGEDWEHQLGVVIIEIAGLGSLFGDDLDFLVLLSKLEGLQVEKDKIAFLDYRKAIFDSIDLLNKLIS